MHVYPSYVERYRLYICVHTTRVNLYELKYNVDIKITNHGNIKKVLLINQGHEQNNTMKHYHSVCSNNNTLKMVPKNIHADFMNLTLN